MGTRKRNCSLRKRAAGFHVRGEAYTNGPLGGAGPIPALSRGIVVGGRVSTSDVLTDNPHGNGETVVFGKPTIYFRWIPT